MKTQFDDNNLNWLWRRLDGGGRVEGWSLASDGQFDCIVRASDGAVWRRLRGFGIWAAAPPKNSPPAKIARRTRRVARARAEAV